MATSAKLGYTEATSATDNVPFVNDAQLRLEHALVINALDFDLDTPPGGPSKGDTYILEGGSASGDWAGEDGKIAVFDGTSWVFVDPDSSMIAYIDDTKERWAYDGNESEWYPLQPIWSTTEHWTGKFKDGSKVYSKVVDFGALPNTTFKNVAHGITGLDLSYEKSRTCEGTVSDGTSVRELSSVSVSAAIHLVTISASNVTIAASYDATSYEAYIRLEYCKT